MGFSSNVKRTYRITLVAFLAAQALVLAYIESIIPLGGMPQGIKLGFSNIIVMYTLGTLGTVPAIFTIVALAGLRSILSFVLRFAADWPVYLVCHSFRVKKIGF